jgi:hypothetical protein
MIVRRLPNSLDPSSFSLLSPTTHDTGLPLLVILSFTLAIGIRYGVV